MAGQIRNFEQLADEMIFAGMTPERLAEVADYMPGKTFADVVAAVRGAQALGGHGTEAICSSLETELLKIVALKAV